jgi:hypothetical protein
VVPDLERRLARLGRAATGRPTLRIASKKSRGLPHSELTKIAVTLTAIATIAQTEWIRPRARALTHGIEVDLGAPIDGDVAI